jgi:hypothetical protein
MLSCMLPITDYVAMGVLVVVRSTLGNINAFKRS